MNFEYDRQMSLKIRILRQAGGLSQEQLTAKMQTYGCDIARSGLAKIEVGQRHIYAHEIKAFKVILNASDEDIFV